jgi:hypothetical protein
VHDNVAQFVPVLKTHDKIVVNISAPCYKQ